MFDKGQENEEQRRVPKRFERRIPKRILRNWIIKELTETEIEMIMTYINIYIYIQWKGDFFFYLIAIITFNGGIKKIFIFQ